MSAITLQGEIVHYEVLGRGRPLFFLHGWVGSWRYWIPSMQATAIAFRAYALDLWGFGDTNKSERFYSLNQQVGLLDGFMENLGIGKIAVIGHGLGGLVALSFTARFPNLVDRILITGLPLNGSTVNPRLRSANPLELADWVLSRNPGTDAARSEAPKADPKAIAASLDDLQRMDLSSLITRMTTPCLFVYGQSDPVVTAPDLEEASSVLPENIHSILFEQSGHFPMLDEPTQFNRLLNDFLALNSGESPRQLQLKEEWKRRIR
jgi:pimeloyl-ACP methyl ester carboxylesterase